MDGPWPIGPCDQSRLAGCGPVWPEPTGAALGPHATGRPGQQRRATVSQPCWSAAVSERSPGHARIRIVSRRRKSGPDPPGLCRRYTPGRYAPASSTASPRSTSSSSAAWAAAGGQPNALASSRSEPTSMVSRNLRATYRRRAYPATQPPGAAPRWAAGRWNGASRRSAELPHPGVPGGSRLVPRARVAVGQQVEGEERGPPTAQQPTRPGQPLARQRVLPAPYPLLVWAPPGLRERHGLLARRLIQRGQGHTGGGKQQCEAHVLHKRPGLADAADRAAGLPPAPCPPGPEVVHAATVRPRWAPPAMPGGQVAGRRRGKATRRPSDTAEAEAHPAALPLGLARYALRALSWRWGADILPDRGALQRHLAGAA
jgi:hypothetical protein